VAPDATGAPGRPGGTAGDRTTAPSAPATGRPAPSDPPAEQPVLPVEEPDKGVLGGLLDGIFGK
jgi:hypothetical protein